MDKRYKADDIVKSCPKLESGLRFGQEGIHACQLGPFASPIYWNSDEAAELEITKEMIIEKRKKLFEILNDVNSDIACKSCHMVVARKFKEVSFSGLGHIDFSATSICNLRCNFCGYTKTNNFKKARYDSLKILKIFSREDVWWNSAVDFGGGEPTILPNFDECLDFFHKMKIRIFLYTNVVEYSPKAYEGLKKGSISWIITSLDCGTPSSFYRTKGRDVFFKVMENITRYADAGSHGGGQLAVKYIFTEDNCADDDISGFVYAMLAIRPQQIWLTFDFEPIQSLPGNTKDFGGYDYSKHVEAYVKTFMTLKKHGIIAGHFTENHLAQIGNQGKLLMQMVKEEISQWENTEHANELLLKNFRSPDSKEENIPEYTTLNPELLDKILKNNQKILVVPACKESAKLLKFAKNYPAQITGIIDRTQTMHGKKIEGKTVYGYDNIKKLNHDTIIIACAEKIEKDILKSVGIHKNESAKIFLYKQDMK